MILKKKTWSKLSQNDLEWTDTLDILYRLLLQLPKDALLDKSKSLAWSIPNHLVGAGLSHYYAEAYLVVGVIPFTMR